jgi:PAS domain S-box-containing protein
MTAGKKADRIRQILDALKKASDGDYSEKIDSASKTDDLGLIAEAINGLLSKTDKRISSMTQFISDLAADAGRYRNIIEGIEESYFEVDLKGHLQFFNARVMLDLGYSEEDLLGMHFHQLADPQNTQKLYDAFHKVFVTGQPIKSFEWEILKKNKEKIDVEASIALRCDETGKPVGFRGVVRDVSQRKKAEDAIYQSEERYRTILDITEEGYIENDLAGRITFANETACRLMGYERKRLIGMHYHEFLSAAVAEHMREVFQRVYITSKPELLVDYDLVRTDGTVKSYQMNIALRYDALGNACGFGILTRDLSLYKEAREALQKSEEKYRNILENMAETYLETDAKGNFLFFNDSLCRVLGYSRAELQGANYKTISPPGNLHLIFDSFNEIFRTGKTKTFNGHELLAKDGAIVYLDMSIALMRSTDGEPIGFSGLGRDVTEKIKAQRKNEESARRLRLITDNIADIIWTMDFNLNWTYLSPSVLQLTGFTREEVMHIPLKAILPPEITSQVGLMVQEEMSKEVKGEVPKEKRLRTFEMPMMRKDGSYIWVEISATFNRDEHGNPFEIVGVTRNITERKKVQDALLESEKRYRMIAENMSDIVWTIGMDLRFIYVSPSSTRVTGYTPEEAMSRPLNELLTPQSFNYATGRLAEELALENSRTSTTDQTRPVTLEVEAIDKNGSTFWLEITGTFNRNSEGVITEILAVGRNITERKKVQNALHESEKLYRMIVDNMSDTIWTMDFNLQYTYLSPAITQLTGYTIEEIKAVPLDRQLTPASMEVVAKVLSEEFEPGYPPRPKNPDTSLRLELEVVRKDGSLLWQELTLTFKPDDQGNPVEILGVARDISERKKAQAVIAESEQRYRMIMENMHEIIWTTDLNMRSTYVSPSCFHLTGYTPEELLLLPPDQVITPESMILAATAVSEELTLEFGGQPLDPHRSKTIEQEILCKNGGTLWLEVTATFIRDDEGKPTGMLMAGRDISLRKKAEQEKQQLEGHLIQAQKMETVGRLAGGVAHDFNNMLSVILGYVDLAKLRLAKQHPVLKDIAEIEKAAVRSRDITTQLLAFSRKQVIEPKIIDLNDLVSHTEKALIRLIGEDIELKVLTEKNLWAILFDPSQIEQILINLAVNARDAMPDGGKLTIETTNLVLDEFYCRNHIDAHPGSYVRLTVSDNGTGMNKDTLEHIFEPFFTTKEVGKGTGLGLATVYGIVKQNNGFLNVYSEPGNGTTFSIYLPRTTEAKETQDASEDELPLTGAGNILLVEDDAMVLQITRGMLESIGYSVTAVDAPGEALSLFEKAGSLFDLVITDVVMPAMSGKELRNKLLEIQPETKVLFMSGYTADVIAHHGVLEEGVHFLQKPFTIRSLAGKVSDVMTKSP